MRQLRWLAGFMVFGLMVAACGGGDQRTVESTSLVPVVSTSTTSSPPTTFPWAGLRGDDVAVETVEGWETYQDEAGWSIQYPPGWSCYEEEPVSESVLGALYQGRSSVVFESDTEHPNDGVAIVEHGEWGGEPIDTASFLQGGHYDRTMVNLDEPRDLTMWLVDLGDGRSMPVFESPLMPESDWSEKIVQSFLVQGGDVWVITVFADGEAIEPSLRMLRTFWPPMEARPVTTTTLPSVEGKEGWVTLTSGAGWTIGAPKGWTLSEAGFTHLRPPDQDWGAIMVGTTDPSSFRPPVLVADTDEWVANRIESYVGLEATGRVETVSFAGGEFQVVFFAGPTTGDANPTAFYYESPFGYELDASMLDDDALFFEMLSTFTPIRASMVTTTTTLPFPNVEEWERATLDFGWSIGVPPGWELRDNGPYLLVDRQLQSWAHLEYDGGHPEYYPTLMTYEFIEITVERTSADQIDAWVAERSEAYGGLQPTGQIETVELKSGDQLQVVTFAYANKPETTTALGFYLDPPYGYEFNPSLWDYDLFVKIMSSFMPPSE